MYKTWDVEAQSEANSVDLPDMIQGLTWNGNGSLLGATCKDKNVRVFDIRNMASSCQTFEGHDGSKSSRLIFCDNKNKIVVTGFNKQSTRKIRVYDSRNTGAGPLADIELDQSAGVLMPFYEEDTGVLYVTGKGDGTIRYYEMTEEKESIYYLESFSSNEPHKGVAMAPRLACDTSVCEIARFFRILKDCVEPLQFLVPRKSDLFQDDLYPATWNMQAVLTAADWIAGQTGNKATDDFRTLQGQTEQTVTITKKKSVQELEKELETALARIKQLETQLAAKK